MLIGLKKRPICLLNVSYMTITKVLADRLGLVISCVVSDTQTVFIKGRYIMEGVMVLHKIINELHHQPIWVLIEN